MKIRSEFRESVKRLAKQYDQLCKNNPHMQQRREARERQRETYLTHKNWAEDRDVHGSLGFYCWRCGIWKDYFGFDSFHPDTFKTCDELVAGKKK